MRSLTERGTRATSGARHLDDQVNLFDALETVARLQGRWDVAYTTTQRADLVEADFLAAGTGKVCRRARRYVVTNRDFIVSPRATAQLQRTRTRLSRGEDLLDVSAVLIPGRQPLCRIEYGEIEYSGLPVTYSVFICTTTLFRLAALSRHIWRRSHSI